MPCGTLFKPSILLCSNRQSMGWAKKLDYFVADYETAGYSFGRLWLVKSCLLAYYRKLEPLVLWQPGHVRNVMLYGIGALSIPEGHGDDDPAVHSLSHSTGIYHGRCRDRFWPRSFVSHHQGVCLPRAITILCTSFTGQHLCCLASYRFRERYEHRAGPLLSVVQNSTTVFLYRLGILFFLYPPHGIFL